jgi:hypothetical protein
MKEIKTNNHPIINTHYPLAKENQFSKRWHIAQSLQNRPQQRLQNDAVEFDYHRILDVVKRLYLKHGEVYFDRDYKHDKTENCLAMHSFMTPTFYWYLECDFCYDFRVEYDFCNCPFESSILAMLKPYPMDRASKRIQLKPDFNTYYNGVVKVQDAKYIHSLKR